MGDKYQGLAIVLNIRCVCVCVYAGCKPPNLKLYTSAYDRSCDQGKLSGTITEVMARRPRLVLGLVNTSLTDRLYIRYPADTEVK